MPDRIKADFEQYHAANPHIYAAFVQFTLYIIGKRERFGAKAIMERVRWHTLESGDDGFKINNNYTALYARKFMREHPEHAGFFVTRERAGERRAA